MRVLALFDLCFQRRFFGTRTHGLDLVIGNSAAQVIEFPGPGQLVLQRFLREPAALFEHQAGEVLVPRGA